jgi:hypothetical protein
MSTALEVAPARDLMQPIGRTPNWSENLLFVMYGRTGSAAPAGWAHWSRVPARPQLWEGILALYLPDGGLLLHRSFGAGPEPQHAASSGPLSFRCVQPMRHWSIHLDGMMRRTDTAQVTTGTLPDGPWEPVRFDAEFTGIAPTWSAHGLDRQEWADEHLEQPGRIVGSVRIGDTEYALDTHGFRDHSYGPRDYAKILGDGWLSGVFPSGRTVLAIVVWTLTDGVPPYVVGFVDDQHGRHPVTDFRLPMLAGADGSPAEFTAEVRTEQGSSTIEVAMTHRTNYTLDNPVGMTLGTRGDPSDLIAVEGPARLRWDGEETDGWIERFIRVNRLTQS